jgi:hypothetical protein
MPFSSNPAITMSMPSVIRRVRTIVALPFAAAAVAALANCTSLTNSDLQPNRYGSVSIRARNAAGNRASANATAIFFDAFQVSLPNSQLSQTDQCAFAAVDTTTSIAKGVKKAGAQILLGIAGTSVPLSFEDANARYLNPAASPFGYASGDNVQVTIPGDTASYPAATLSLRLAEPLIPGTITVPSGTTPMVFTWNPSANTDSSSAIILSLRYANPPTSTYANEQIYCQLKDDGSYQLGTNSLSAFIASPNNLRSLIMTRWRTRAVQLDSRTVLHVATSVDTIVTFQP